jgi:hypothetical protein
VDVSFFSFWPRGLLEQHVKTGLYLLSTKRMRANLTKQYILANMYKSDLDDLIHLSDPVSSTFPNYSIVILAWYLWSVPELSAG